MQFRTKIYTIYQKDSIRLRGKYRGLLLLLLLLKCTYLSDTITQNAAVALYTVNKSSSLPTGKSKVI